MLRIHHFLNASLPHRRPLIATPSDFRSTHGCSLTRLEHLFCQATDITQLLAKFGRPWHYASGGRGALRRVWLPYLVSARQGGIEIDGQSICVGWHRSLPLRCWICPCCQRDAYKLRQVGGRWACSRCHSLTWASRHTARTIPGLLKLQRLRLRIGANPTPFTSLPTKPKPKTTVCEHLRLMRRIRVLERGLVQHAHNDVAAILEIRLEKRYVRP